MSRCRVTPCGQKRRFLGYHRHRARSGTNLRFTGTGANSNVSCPPRSAYEDEHLWAKKDTICKPRRLRDATVVGGEEDEEEGFGRDKERVGDGSAGLTGQIFCAATVADTKLMGVVVRSRSPIYRRYKRLIALSLAAPHFPLALWLE
jgi:hypothetical protein